MGLYRDQARILVDLFHNTSTISGNILCQKLDIGLKTLKKEINILNNTCLENGCEIKSKPGEGYYLEVSDPEDFVIFREDVEKKYHNNLYFRDEHSELAHLVIRLFLTKKNMFIDDLAAMCLCSESTINREMKKIRQRLKEYKLELVNKTNHGLSLKGSEWHIRLALICEYFLYNDFEMVNQFDSEAEFNEMFMHQGIYVNMVTEKVMETVARHDYHVPYYTFEELADMIILTITRKKYSHNLEQDIGWFEKAECLEEQAIIKEIFKDIPGLYGFELTYAETLALAIYLRSHKVIKYHDFVNLNNHEHVSALVEEFLEKLQQIYRFPEFEFKMLRKDLCCELSRLFWKQEYDIHAFKYRISHFQRDGVFNLDLCTLLYLFLKENTGIDFQKDDIGMFYYIFSAMSKQIISSNTKNIYVISKMGFYVSRSLARNMQDKCDYSTVGFHPIEYHELLDLNMSKVDAIFTDISELKNDFYYKKVCEIYYFRERAEVNALVREVLAKDDFIRKHFREEDVSYVSGLTSLEEVKNHIVNNLLQEGDDRELVLQRFENKHSLYSARRANGIVLMNTLGDCLGRSFLKIVLLKNDIMISDNLINIIVFYNVADADICKCVTLSKQIARLFRAQNLMVSGERKKDYELLKDILSM